MIPLEMSRRTFVAMSGLSPLAFAAGKKVPVGLELFSVRDALMQDLTGTVRAVAKMGYEVVEFYAPYFSWTPAYAKDIRKLLDDLGIRCNSTHNNPASFTAEGLPKAIELNQIIGSRNIVMASAGRVDGIAGWKALGEQMTKVSETLKSLGMGTGFHNHQTLPQSRMVGCGGESEYEQSERDHAHKRKHRSNCGRSAHASRSVIVSRPCG